MPPKRKAAETKTAEVVANGAETTDAPKPKRGKATKQAEKSESAEETKKVTRNTRAKTAPVEKQPVVQEKPKKERKAKTQAEKPPIEEPEAEEPTEKAPAQKAQAGKSTKEKVAKPKKETKTKKKKVVVVARKSEVKTPKAKTTRHAKKKNEQTQVENSEPKTKSKAKQAETNTKPLQNQTETDYTEIDFSCTKKNAQGEKPNFKITSWNVDGLRAWLKKKGLEYIERDHPDILCLQETKCSKEKIPDELCKVLDYKSYWCSGEKEGYAGVALFSKKDPISVEYGIGDEEFDKEGRCITAEYDDFYLVNVYVPNAGRKLVTLPKRLEWNTLFKDFIARLDEKKAVIVCGDMNVAHNEIDLANPKTNKKNAGFTQEEREGFTDFLAENYIDTYRDLYPDKTNAYTFWSYMMKARAKDIGWRLDYFIVSKPFMDNVCDNVIRSNVFGSDHCPITLYLNVQNP